MIDLAQLRQTIEVCPPKGRVAAVSRRWLEEVERDLAELAEIRKKAEQA